MDLYSQEIQEKKRDLQNQPQTIKKMEIGTYISIITLNVNGLNAQTKGHRLDECIKKKKKTHTQLSTRNPLQSSKHIQTERERMEKYIPCKWEAKGSWRSNLIADKIDFKIKDYER